MQEIKLASMLVYMTDTDEVKYVETPMFKIDTEYLGEIPASFVQMRGIEYFLIM